MANLTIFDPGKLIGAEVLRILIGSSTRGAGYLTSGQDPSQPYDAELKMNVELGEIDIGAKALLWPGEQATTSGLEFVVSTRHTTIYMPRTPTFPEGCVEIAFLEKTYLNRIKLSERSTVQTIYVGPKEQ